MFLFLCPQVHSWPQSPTWQLNMGMFHPHPWPSLIHPCITLTRGSSPILMNATQGHKIHNSGTFPLSTSLHSTHTSRQGVSPALLAPAIHHHDTFTPSLVASYLLPSNQSMPPTPWVPDQHQRSFYTLRPLDQWRSRSKMIFETNFLIREASLKCVEASSQGVAADRGIFTWPMLFVASE